MKKARQLLSPIEGRKAVVFRVRGSSELYGFSTDMEVPYVEDYYANGNKKTYDDKNDKIKNDTNAFYFNIYNHCYYRVENNSKSFNYTYSIGAGIYGFDL